MSIYDRSEAIGVEISFEAFGEVELARMETAVNLGHFLILHRDDEDKTYWIGAVRHNAEEDTE